MSPNRIAFYDFFESRECVPICHVEGLITREARVKFIHACHIDFEGELCDIWVGILQISAPGICLPGSIVICFKGIVVVIFRFHNPNKFDQFLGVSAFIIVENSSFDKYNAEVLPGL